MIVKPENMDFSKKNIIMIISGLPGVEKPPWHCQPRMLF